MKYSIGLDIGTNSVGYAVIDGDCNLIKKSGKNLIGVRLFEEAKTAAETRTFRGNRRRLIRRKNRINFLRELIGESVLKNDSEFFTRLENSFYLEDDKISVKSKNILFNDKNYKDKQYFKKYPTIYHLRKSLMENKEKHDIREVYLAFHHIIKYRGHFLIDGELNSVSSYKNDVFQLFEEVYNYYQFTNQGSVEIEELANYICENIEKDITTGEKIKSIESYIKSLDKSKEDQNILNQIVKLIFGRKVNFQHLYSGISEKKEIAINSESIDVEIENLTGGDFYIFEYIKNAYSSITLSEILKGETSISVAMVNKFNKHKKDLTILKKIYKYNDKKRYYTVFKSGEKLSYNAYINNNKKKEEKSCDYETFTKEIKKDLELFKKKNNSYDNEIEKIFLDIENGTFLPKQRTTDNVSIPNQLHFNELVKIIENQSEYYDCLKVNKEKILSIFKFKIPYYVGPLTGNYNANKEGKRIFAWATRSVDGVEIRPWNFDEIIDKDTSAEEFINRMRNKCSYITSEDTLPANSVYLCEFNLYNELNKIKINGKILDYQTKEKLVDNLFKVMLSDTENRKSERTEKIRIKMQ